MGSIVYQTLATQPDSVDTGWNPTGEGAGGGGGGTANIKALVAGVPTSLATGDIVQVGGVSSGTPGSGSATVAVLGLDSNGNAIANIVPRTNTLAALLALASEHVGELASASDVFAIVQYQASDVNLIYQPDVADFTAASGVVPSYARTVYLTNGSSGTYTIANGSIPGQLLDIEVTQGNPTIAGFKAAFGSVITFQWTGSSWILVAEKIGATSNVSAVSATPGTVGGALAAGAAQLGGSNAFASNVVARATGYASFAASGGGTQGQFSFAVNQGYAVGDYSFAWGYYNSFNSVAQGVNSVAQGGSAVGNYNASIYDSVVPTIVTALTGSTIVVSFALTAPQAAFFTANVSKVVFSVGAANASNPPNFLGAPQTGVSFTGLVTAVNTGTGLVTVTFNNVGTGPAFDGTQAQLLATGGGVLTNVSSGQSSIGLRNAQVNNQFAIGEGSAASTSAVQISQRVRYIYTLETAATTAGQQLTLDGQAFNAHPLPGECNIYVTNDVGLLYGAYAIEMTLVAKDKTAAGAAMMKRTFLVTNDNGTMAISAQTAVGTDVFTGTLASMTYAANVTLSVDATYKGLVVKVTPVSAHSTQWTCHIDQVDAA